MQSGKDSYKLMILSIKLFFPAILNRTREHSLSPCPGPEKLIFNTKASAGGRLRTQKAADRLPCP